MTTPAITRDPAPFERLSAMVIGIVFLSSVLLHAVGWNWIFDTAYLIAAVWVAVPRSAGAGSPAPRLPYVSLYLFIESALQALVAACFPGTTFLVFLALAGLYGAALERRLRASGIAPGSLPWRALLRGPAARITLGAAVPLACLYLPMIHVYHPDVMWSGPMVVTVGHATVMNAGHPIDLGTKLTLRGFEVAFGRAACLLLAAILAANLLRSARLARPAAALRFMRAATVAVAIWWLVAARGYASLDSLFNLGFLAGCAWLLVTLFTWPARADAAGVRDGGS